MPPKDKGINSSSPKRGCSRDGQLMGESKVNTATIYWSFLVPGTMWRSLSTSFYLGWQSHEMVLITHPHFIDEGTSQRSEWLMLTYQGQRRVRKEKHLSTELKEALTLKLEQVQGHHRSVSVTLHPRSLRCFTLALSRATRQQYTWDSNSDPPGSKALHPTHSVVETTTLSMMPCSKRRVST